MKQEQIRASFGKQLRKLRDDRRMTQEDLADKANLHPTYIGQIERGLRNPSLVNLYKLAKALKVNAGELLPF
jgi:transcriptional regulator with XRE-family HTH domain